MYSQNAWLIHKYMQYMTYIYIFFVVSKFYENYYTKIFNSTVLQTFIVNDIALQLEEVICIN